MSSPASLIKAYPHVFTKSTSIVLKTLFITSHKNPVLSVTQIVHNASVSRLAKNALLITLWKTAHAVPVAQTNFTTSRRFFAMISPTFVWEISISAFPYTHVSSVCKTAEDAHQQLLANSVLPITLWKTAHAVPVA
jgi:hypothetical protein